MKRVKNVLLQMFLVTFIFAAFPSFANASDNNDEVFESDDMSTWSEAVSNASNNAIITIDGDDGMKIIGNNGSEQTIPRILPRLTSTGIAPFAIIGTDNREQVTNVSGFGAIVEIKSTFMDGSVSYGTGTFITNDIILTAGHMVYDEPHRWGMYFDIYPGGSNSGYASFFTTRYSVKAEWVNNKNYDYDYALIKLERGNTSAKGYMNVKVQPNSNLLSKSIIHYGFSGDKPKGTLWKSTGTISTLTTLSLVHDADTMVGNSGGPIIYANSIVGVHSAYDPVYRKNTGVRITSEIIEHINGYVE